MWLRNEANFCWREMGYGFWGCGGRGGGGLEAVGTEAAKGFEGPVVGTLQWSRDGVADD